MDKIRIRQNYLNYNRVKNYLDYNRVKDAFGAFIRALVWESMDIDEGVHEDEIESHIEKYCNAHGDQMIALANNSVTKFIKGLTARFEVHCYEIDDNGNAHEIIAKRISTNNEAIALKKAAEHYRYGKRPHVKIYDNETNKYIVEWDCA